MNLRDELQNIISGIGENAEGNLIKAAANHLRESKKAGGSVEAIEFTKDEEAKRLIHWVYAEVGVLTDSNQNDCY